ncbi:unnamed protein product [Symbiodinium microadriaticum]|nr:unnamed protein product [Symbiodinium microadriaticum]
MAQSSAEFDRLMTALSNSAAYSQDEYRQIEKIIKWVQDRQSPPATPEAARRHMARGEAATEMATDPNGYQAAIREFKAATRLAPWLADPHYNLGILQDRIKQYDRAIKSLTLYLLAAPDAGDRDATQSLIYKIEFKKEQD